MAVEISDGGATPHATDYEDLLDKLVTFATASGWTELENYPGDDKVVLQGEGDGTQEIVVAFQKYEDVPNDAQGWFINGYSGWTDGLGFTEQPGAIPNWSSSSVPAYPAIPLWNSEIPYWFIVNSRRIIVVAKISTTYQMCYAGFFLPFASPGQFPYPMMVGGSAAKSSTTTKPRFSVATSKASMFWTGREASPSTINIRSTDGSWYSIANGYQTGTFLGDISGTGMYPYYFQGVPIVGSVMRQAMDGDAVLTPIMPCRSGTGLKGYLGEIDGMFHVSGNTHASEDIITIDGDDHLVVQDVFRTAVENYCAVKLV